MARTRRSTRSRSTSRSSRGSGGSLARFLLPAAALGIGAYLLWPKPASAAVLPPTPPGPAPGPPNPLPPPPAPGIGIEPVADAPLTGGTSRGRIVNGTDIVVRNGFTDTSPIVSRLPQGAGVAVLIGPPAPPTANAPQGRIRVRTARGAEGYVAAQFVRIDAQPTPGTAGWAAGWGRG